MQESKFDIVSGDDAATALLRAQARCIESNAPLMLAANLACAAALLFIFQASAMPPFATAGWLAALAFALGWSARLSWQCRRGTLRGEPHRAMLKFRANTLMYGLVWAAPTVIAAMLAKTDFETPVLVLQGIMLGSVVIYQAMSRRTAAMFMIPVIVSIALRYLMEDTTAEVLTGAIVLLYGPLLFALMHGVERMLAENIAARMAIQADAATLDRQREHFRVIADCSSSWELWIDERGLLKWTSPSVEAVTSYAASELAAMPKRGFERVHRRDRAALARLLRCSLAGPPGGRMDFRFAQRDGALAWCSAIWTRVALAGGAFGGLRVSVRNISERKALEAALEQLAYADPLTGVMNRRSFVRAAEAELARAARNGRPLCIAMLDVDHFKRVNDSFGHAAGDLCLKALADAIGGRLRASCRLARFGGEEFAILLPDSDIAGAQLACEALRRLVAGLRVATDQGEVAMTVSIGVSAALPAGDEAQAVIERADQALYFAKRSGRDQVKVADLATLAAQMGAAGRKAA